tara:strand:- start:13 stop:126 length:114 start_codon:yes stop_codon:yes gene_type:complete
MDADDKNKYSDTERQYRRDATDCGWGGGAVAAACQDP